MRKGFLDCARELCAKQRCKYQKGEVQEEGRKGTGSGRRVGAFTFKKKPTQRRVKLI